MAGDEGDSGAGDAGDSGTSAEFVQIDSGQLEGSPKVTGDLKAVDIAQKGAIGRAVSIVHTLQLGGTELINEERRVDESGCLIVTERLPLEAVQDAEEGWSLVQRRKKNQRSSPSVCENAPQEGNLMESTEVDPVKEDTSDTLPHSRNRNRQESRGYHSGVQNGAGAGNQRGGFKTEKEYKSGGGRRGTANSKNVPLKFNSGQQPLSWADICLGSGKKKEDCNLRYHAPVVLGGRSMASISDEDIDVASSFWSNTIIAYVMGSKPSFQHLKGYVQRAWKPTCSLDIYSRENGYFFFRLGSAEECQRILDGGPWIFDGRLLIMRKWHPSVGLERDLLSRIPVWVRLPALNIKFWSAQSISKIASLLGTPLYMDEMTAKMQRIAFARVFVEIDAGKELLKTIPIVLDDGSIEEQKVEYEWVSPKCAN